MGNVVCVVYRYIPIVGVVHARKIVYVGSGSTRHEGYIRRE